MAKKMLFVYNPKSGKGAVRSKIADILEIFTEGGYDVLVHPTRAPGDAAKTVRKFAEQVDVVVCSGGDGTMDQVVMAVMETDPMKKVGYIPSGSTNDFANSLGLPKNILKSARGIIEGDMYSCDIGAFNKKYFVYVAAFGAFTHIAYDTDQNLKNTIGHFAYLAQAGMEVFKLPRYHIQADADGQLIEGDYTYGMITNSRFVGGIPNITGKAVDMDDGLFEITLVHMPANPLELTEIFTTLLSKDILQSPLVEKYKASRIRISCEEKIDWTLDGEFGGSCKHADIRNLTKKLQIYRPR